MGNEHFGDDGSCMRIWQDGVYGIDSEPEGDQAHQILVDLGKSLERMLTMDRELVRCCA